MKKTKWIVAAASTIAVGLALSACSSGDPLSGGSESKASGAQIIVGSANFPESNLLATIYQQALTKDGLSATTKLNIGSREVYFPALKDGSIDLIPEYTGATLSYLKSHTQASSPEDVNAALGQALPKGLTMLTPSDAQDSDVLAVTKETAKKYNLTTISSLKPYASKLALGGPAEWKTRHEGVKGLASVYGLNFKSFRSLDTAGPLTVSALKNGQVHAADMFSTDPQMKNFVALKDDKSLFPAQNIVPIINSNKLNSKVQTALDEVSSKLTTADLVEMNAKIADKQSITKVAQAWVDSNIK